MKSKKWIDLNANIVFKPDEPERCRKEISFSGPLCIVCKSQGICLKAWLKVKK